MDVRSSIRMGALSLASAAFAASAALVVAPSASASPVADAPQQVTQVVSSQSQSSWHYSGKSFKHQNDCHKYGWKKVHDGDWKKYRCDRYKYWDHDDHKYRYYWKLFYRN
jgi:hypothetical protein